MITLQATLSSKEKKPGSLMETSSKKKRKREEEADKGGVQLTNDSFIELSLETPLPLEWQRCLDIKSGEIHYYNTRTKRRASKDPRIRSTEISSPLQGLDLELSLMCTEPSEIHGLDLQEPSSPPFVVVDASDEQEMVAMVCGRCHMLVMMYKLSPSCPNCRFSNSPGPVSRKIIACGVRIHSEKNPNAPRHRGPVHPGDVGSPDLAPGGSNAAHNNLSCK